MTCDCNINQVRLGRTSVVHVLNTKLVNFTFNDTVARKKRAVKPVMVYDVQKI
jgi:hypothetical protein